MWQGATLRYFAEERRSAWPGEDHWTRAGGGGTARAGAKIGNDERFRTCAPNFHPNRRDQVAHAGDCLCWTCRVRSRSATHRSTGASGSSAPDSAGRPPRLVRFQRHPWSMMPDLRGSSAQTRRATTAVSTSTGSQEAARYPTSDVDASARLRLESGGMSAAALVMNALSGIVERTPTRPGLRALCQAAGAASCCCSPRSRSGW
jgi:hypothetical protein